MRFVADVLPEVGKRSNRDKSRLRLPLRFTSWSGRDGAITGACLHPSGNPFACDMFLSNCSRLRDAFAIVLQHPWSTILGFCWLVLLLQILARYKRVLAIDLTATIPFDFFVGPPR